MTRGAIDVKHIELPTYVYHEEYERLPRGELLRLQLERLLAFLRRVAATNDFHQRRFAAAAVDVTRLASLAEFRRHVPFITKQDLLADQEANPPFGTRLGVPAERLRKIHTTSGTTGLGQEIYGLTENDCIYEGSGVANCVRWIGIEPGDICALTYPFTTSSAGQCTAEGMRLYGSVLLPLALYDGKTKLRFMRDFGAHYLLTAPAYLTRLTTLCRELGWDPKTDFPKLKAITVSTEAFPVAWAESMREVWRKPIHEMYGSTQQGSYFAYTCSGCGAVRNGERGVLHMPEYATLMEVIDPASGEQVGYGEEGEAVITTFSRESSPLIRFRTGDRVTLIEPTNCSSGRTLDGLLVGAVSRYDDMMKIKGANVWPSAIDNVIFSYPEADEYNGRVYLDGRGAERVEISLEFKPEVANAARKQDLMREMRAEIKNRTQVSMEIREVAPGTVERFDWKPRRWKDQRQEGLARTS